MGKVQTRHSKLWFAGVNENWELAEFEMHELEEVIEDIRTVYPNREETQSLPIIEPSLETVNNAIKQRDRSEEHTSELQSREKLVCRLLLEKKNKNIN